MDDREFRLEHAKLLSAERDAINRVYYALWIVFMGGFVLSLHITSGPHVTAARIAIVAFRVLAIAGTAINFAMQYFSLDSLGSFRQAVFREAFGKHLEAEEADPQSSIEK